MAVVITDGLGRVVAVRSKNFNFLLGLLESKAKAMEVTVIFALKVGTWYT